MLYGLIRLKIYKIGRDKITLTLALSVDSGEAYIFDSTNENFFLIFIDHIPICSCKINCINKPFFFPL